MKILLIATILALSALAQGPLPSGGGGGGGGGGLPAGCTVSAGVLTCTGFDAGGASPTNNGAITFNGVTSGGITFTVANAAGTATAYVWPSTVSTTNQVLTDNGSITCPTDFLNPGALPCRQLIWATPAAATSQVDFQPATSAISMTGSDVTIYSTAGVTLAAGQCLRIDFIGTNASAAGNTTYKIKVGATVVATPFTGFGAANLESAVVHYCNNPGSTTVQSVDYSPTPPNYNTNAAASITNFYIAAVGNFATPTAVNWGSAQTVSLTAVDASGTVTGFRWRIVNE